jgi:hypothetical protein
MNINARIKKLENSIKPDKIPNKISDKYSILTYSKELNPENAKEKAISEISSKCNISTEKAKDYLSELPVIVFLPENGRDCHEY